MKKFSSVLILVFACFSFVFLSKSIKEPAHAKAWVGVSYLMADSGYSNEEVAGVGAFGVLHGAMHGAIWGAAFGGPAGIVAGGVVGL